MGLFELILFLSLCMAAGIFCWIMVETDRRIREWMYHDELYRQNLGEIDGAELIQSLKKGGDK